MFREIGILAKKDWISLRSSVRKKGAYIDRMVLALLERAAAFKNKLRGSKDCDRISATSCLFRSKGTRASTSFLFRFTEPAITEPSAPIAGSNRRRHQNKLVSSRIVLALLEHAADFKNKLGGSLFLKQLGARPGCAGSDPRVQGTRYRNNPTPRGVRLFRWRARPDSNRRSPP